LESVLKMVSNTYCIYFKKYIISKIVKLYQKYTVSKFSKYFRWLLNYFFIAYIVTALSFFSNYGNTICILICFNAFQTIPLKNQQKTKTAKDQNMKKINPFLMHSLHKLRSCICFCFCFCFKSFETHFSVRHFSHSKSQTTQAGRSQNERTSF